MSEAPLGRYPFFIDEFVYATRTWTSVLFELIAHRYESKHYDDFKHISGMSLPDNRCRKRLIDWFIMLKYSI